MFANTPGEPNRLRFFIAEQKSIIVVTFVGSMARENTGIMEECLGQILEKNGSWVILNFRDVPPTNERMICQALARLKKTLRERGAHLRLSSVHPEFRKFLEQQGVVRAEEVSNNLVEALKTLPALERAAA